MYTIEAESIIKDFERMNTSLDEFLANLQLKIIKRTDSEVEFDLLNCHPSIANLLRRVLISKVPTMAIHNVSVHENSSIFPDEYIAHRLGLVPLFVDPRSFDAFVDIEEHSNVLNFSLKVSNEGKEDMSVTSESIVFIPMRGQEHLEVTFKPGVVLCKLGPGHQLEMNMKATKGTGEQHAKWSPVSLCTYKLMPRIVLEREFAGAEALELQKCFSPGVIEIEDGRAVVKNPRLDCMSREVLRHENLRDSVKIMRESGWFCFTVETISIDPIEVLKMGLRAILKCCEDLKAEVKMAAEEYGIE